MSTERFTRSVEFAGFAEEGSRFVGRIVPYDQPAVVPDPRGDYREVFTSTSFAHMFEGIRARGGRCTPVILNLDHSERLDRQIGYSTSLEDQADGVYATFELWDVEGVDRARAMLRSTHTGMSIDFGARSKRVWADGAIERLGVHLYAVAATPTPVYAAAGIVEWRATDQLPALATPRLDEMLERWGLEHLRCGPDTAELAPDSAAPDSAAPSP